MSPSLAAYSILAVWEGKNSLAGVDCPNQVTNLTYCPNRKAIIIAEDVEQTWLLCKSSRNETAQRTASSPRPRDQIIFRAKFFSLQFRESRQVKVPNQ